MKDKNIAAILAFPLFGGLGAHKFYLGQVGAGIVYLAFAWTLIPAIVSFFEFVILALMDRDEFNRRYNGSYALGQSPVVVNMLPPGPAYYPHPHQPYPPPPGYPPYPYPGSIYPANTYPQPGYPPPQPGYPPPSASPPPRASTDEVIARLEKLNELRIAGLLTDEEFAQQKARILDQL